MKKHECFLGGKQFSEIEALGVCYYVPEKYVFKLLLY